MDLENFLRAHWSFLIDKTTNYEKILIILFSKEIITLEDKERIKNPFVNATSNDIYDCLYSTLVRKNLSQDVLKEILLETSNEHIVDKVWNNSEKVKLGQFWNVPHKNENFSGRLNILEEIENFVKSRENSTVKLVVHGMGGVGKTTFVTEYLYRNRMKGKFSNVFWIKGETKVGLDYDLNKISEICQVDKNGFVEWFERGGNSNWLIVFDNVCEYSKISKLIPRFGGTVIVTSRNQIDWDDWSEIKIDNFSQQETIEFVRKILKNENVTNISQLGKELGYLPLALSIATYYMKRSYIKIDKYIKKFQNELKKYLDMKIEFENLTVYTSCKISLDKIFEKSPKAKYWLQMCGFFLPENIPKIFLEECLNLFFKDPKQIEDFVDEIHTEILKYGLVQLNEIEENEVELYSIHRMVQKTIILTIDKQNHLEMLQVCRQITEKCSMKYESLGKHNIFQHSMHVFAQLVNFQDLGKFGFLQRRFEKFSLMIETLRMFYEKAKPFIEMMEANANDQNCHSVESEEEEIPENIRKAGQAIQDSVGKMKENLITLTHACSSLYSYMGQVEKAAMCAKSGEKIRNGEMYGPKADIKMSDINNIMRQLEEAKLAFDNIWV